MKIFIRMLQFGAIFVLASITGLLVSRHFQVQKLFTADGWEDTREHREVLLHLNRYYSLNDEAFQGELSEREIDRFLNSKDPYSDYLSRDEFESFEKETEQEYVGIGVQITRLEPGIIVTKVFADSPAQRSGILPGDSIMEVEGVEVGEFSVSRVVDHITGPPGTEVSLKVFRELSGETLQLTPTRRAIQYPSLSRIEMLTAATGYIKVDEFARRTALEFADALDDLEGRGMEGLIIDLRNNPGGVLDSAVDVAGQFQERGRVIVEVRTFQKKKTEVLRSGTPARPAQYPIVVLLNKSSASASEIVAGSLQIAGKAVILGERSYGKGSVQSIFALSNGDGLRMTTAQYFFTNGESLEDGVGLEPDIPVSHSTEEEYRLKLQEYHREILDDESFQSRFGFEVIEDRQLNEAIRYLEQNTSRS